MVPLCDTPRALCEWLARGKRVDAAALASQRRRVEERPLAYPLGVADAGLVALVAGVARIHAWTVAPAAARAELARVEHLGMASHAAAIDGATRVYVGHEPWRLREAARLEQEHEHVGAGQMLDVPDCCVEASLAIRPRSEAALLQANFGGWRGWGHALLNCCDRRVFHWVPWIPCSQRCWWSLQRAEAVRASLPQYGPYVAQVSAAADFNYFVGAVTRALAAHRLVVLPGVQLSLAGEAGEDGAVTLRRAWATAVDRHPDSPVDPDEGEAAARLLLRLQGVTRVRVEGNAVLFDERPVVRAPHACLACFSAP